MPGVSDVDIGVAAHDPSIRNARHGCARQQLLRNGNVVWVHQADTILFSVGDAQGDHHAAWRRSRLPGRHCAPTGGQHGG